MNGSLSGVFASRPTPGPLCSFLPLTERSKLTVTRQKISDLNMDMGSRNLDPANTCLRLPLTILNMRNLLFVLICFISTFSHAQTGPRLIVRGDDMGYSHAGNEAILKCSREGIQTSIEVIVPSPWFPEAVKMLEEIPDVDVGIHLAITSEWDNVKWRPLTECPSLTDADGYFYPMVSSN